MMSPAQDCRLPGPSLVTARHLRMMGAALLDAGQPTEEVLIAGVAVGDQGPGEQARDPAGDVAFPP
jgi:hypothetical protein